MGRRNTATPLWVLLFLAACFVSYRGNRDVWFVVVAAVTIVAKSLSGSGTPKLTTKGQAIIVSVGVTVMLVLTILAYRISNRELQKVVDINYPANAAAYVEEHRLSGPLYNHFNWGGYLIWRLPNLPVSIDGRSHIHNGSRLLTSSQVWRGEPGWQDDAELTSARLIIAEKRFALAQLLRLDKRFTLVYEDDLSAVFTASGSAQSFTSVR
jgi:hypothetical protein